MNQPFPNDELLSAYLDDELGSEERARVEGRLATDSEYAATLEAFRNVRERLQALPKGSIDVRPLVMNRVNEQSRLATGQRQSNWQAAAWAIASLAALLLVGLFLYLPETEKEFAVVQNEAITVEDRVISEDAEEGDEVALKDGTAAFKFREELPQPESLAAKPESRLRAAADPNETSNQALEALDYGAGRAMRTAPGISQADASRSLTPRAAASQPMGVTNRSPNNRSRKELEDELIDHSLLQRESTPEYAQQVPAFPKPKSAVGASAKDGESLDLETDSDQLEGPEEQLSAKDVFDKLTIDGVFADLDAVKRFKLSLDRIWRLYPTLDRSDERLTLARFRHALEQAGCDYREEKPLSPLGRSSALKKNSKVDDLKKGKQEINFIVVATPEQLVRLRKMADRFADMQRLDITIRSIAAPPPQEDWDGSRLPRQDGLDPAGDGRTYRFLVYPEKDLPAKP